MTAAVDDVGSDFSLVLCLARECASAGAAHLEVIAYVKLRVFRPKQ